MDSIKDIELGIVNWMVQRLQQGVDKDVLQKGLSKAVTHAGQKADEVIALLKEEEEALAQRDAGLARSMEARSEINRILQVPAGAGRPYGGHDLGTLYPEEMRGGQNKSTSQAGILFDTEARGGRSYHRFFAGASMDTMDQMHGALRPFVQAFMCDSEFRDCAYSVLVPDDGFRDVFEEQFPRSIDVNDSRNEHILTGIGSYLALICSDVQHTERPATEIVEKAKQKALGATEENPVPPSVGEYNARLVMYVTQDIVEEYRSRREQSKAPVANRESAVENSRRACFSGASGNDLAEMRKEVRGLCRMLSENREFGDFFCRALVPQLDQRTEIGQRLRETFRSSLAKGESIESNRAIDVSAEFLLQAKFCRPSSDLVEQTHRLCQEKTSTFASNRPVGNNNALFVTFLVRSLIQGFERQRGANASK